MLDPIRLLNLGRFFESTEFKGDGNSSLPTIECDSQLTEVGLDELMELLQKKHIAVVNNQQSLDLYKKVNYRSVESHFLDYVDYIENRQGKLWGESLFSQAYLACLLDAMQNQDYKGSVIFLGENPQVLPTLEVLAKFGFEDFDFLELSTQRKVFEHVQKKVSGLLKTQVSSIDSTALVRSQKEYSLCFVLNDEYTTQTLEDMSYFHFLSSQSVVFDFSGQSNFWFKEVKALGVNVFEFSRLKQILREKLEAKIKGYAIKNS